MVEVYQRRSALSHFSLKAMAAKTDAANAGIAMGEAPHRAIVNIRGDANDSSFTAAVKKGTGFDLPIAANTVAAAGDLRLLWLGPDEWWLVGPDENRSEQIERLKRAFIGQHVAVTDVSESRTVITLSGRAARELLQRGISLDLHPRVFGPGQCAQTGMSKTIILLHQTDSEPTYEIYVLKSFADYLWRWMSLIAEDFGLAIRAE